MDVQQAAVAAWKTFSSRDRDRIRAVLTENVEWIAPPGNATAVAMGVTHHMIGGDAIARFLVDDLPRLYPQGMVIEPLSITSADNRVVIEQRQQAMLANGREYDLIYVFILEMDGARIRQIREYMDTATGLSLVFGNEAPRRIV